MVDVVSLSCQLLNRILAKATLQLLVNTGLA